MRFVSGLVLASAFVLAAGSGVAATIDLSGATGSAISLGDYDNSVFSGNAAFGDVTFSAGSASDDLTHLAGSGLGIDCRGGSLECRVDNRNQIDNGEVLSISFDRPLFVTSVDLRNLFSNDLELGRFSIHVEEGGSVAGGDFAIDFSSDDAGASGRLNLAINRWASSISFVPNSGFLNAFSVAGLSIDEFARALPAAGTSPIPEPSSILLLLIGGAFVAHQVRKRS